MKKIFTHFMLPVLALVGATSGISLAQDTEKTAETQTGTLETMIVASGTVAMDLNLSRLNGAGTGSKTETLRFQAEQNSFLPIVVFNNELRGPKPGTMALLPSSSAVLPAALKASFNQLVLEKTDASAQFEFVIRDAKTGFTFFNIEGHSWDYNATAHSLQITDGRLLISEGFAKNMGRPADAGTVIGNVSIAANMRPIEVKELVNGEVTSAVMPGDPQPDVGSNPGPDVVVGDLPSVQQGGSAGSFVGLGVGTTSCNYGVVDLNWFQLTNTDHPVIPQNMYRMSGGATNTERFEQIGQSWLKHAFTALTENVCSLGCNGTGGTHLGSGCSDPYSASLNYSQGSGSASGLGSRAWVNPFTGAYPSTAANHTGHTHTGTTHRVLVAMSDLSTASNPGATYFAEGQYVTPHEYAWCQSHAGQCNMYNNVSYRQFNVTGTTSFSFSPVAATVRKAPAILAWTGSTGTTIEPAPGVDGVGIVAYKVTNPSAGVWHYEYAVYNSTLDRAIQSFSVPLGCGVTLSNLGFHAPPQHPGIANDGTVGNAGFSSADWTPNQTSNAVSWSSETFAQNQNANAIRWGTIYNFRFDSNKPPTAKNATIGFFKTGAPITVAIQAPTPDACAPLTVTTAVSRKTHAGVGDFDCDLPLAGPAGVEPRSGGGGGDHTIVFTFANNVVSGGATVVSGVGSVAGSPTFSNNTMTVNLTGVTDAQALGVKLTGVTDVFSQTLADTTLTADFLLGDTTGDGSVNVGDTLQTRNHGGQVTDSTNFRFDENLDGSINSGDTTVVRANSGHSIP